jgi:GNAT superfamily N-acetyltransferase
MRCWTTGDPGAFWDDVAGLLLGDPVVNGVLLTNVASRRDGTVVDVAPPSFAAVRDGAGRVVGAAMRTPPFGIVLSALPATAVEPLVGAMAAACPDAVGVSGPAAEAEAFATAWSRLSGGEHGIERRGRLYRLDRVTMSPEPGGGWRVAGVPDRDLLVEWWEAFELEAGLGASGTAARDVDHHLAEDGAFVWIDGEPVSCVATALPAGGVVRVGPVYTPPPHRRRGYASALVAGVSRRALDGGAAACSLYTDLANPTANRIYVALGYRPVADITAYRFAPSQ